MLLVGQQDHEIGFSPSRTYVFVKAAQGQFRDCHEEFAAV